MAPSNFGQVGEGSTRSAREIATLRAVYCLQPRHTMRFAVWCVLLATPAFADDADMRENAMAADEFRLVSTSELGFRYKLEAVAAGFARSTGDLQQGGTATVTAHAGVTASGRCELVGGGGFVSARSSDSTVAVSQWASVCLAWSETGYTSLDHRLDWDLTPRLLATPRVRPGPQRRETVGWDFIGDTIPFREDEPSEDYVEHLQQGIFRTQVSVGWAEGAPRKDVRFDFGVPALRTYIRTYHDDDPPLSIAVIGAQLRVFKITGRDGPLFGGMPLELGHIEGFRIGGGVRLGARFGGFLGGMMEGEKEATRDESVFLAEGALSAERTLLRGAVLRIEGERRSDPTWDGHVAIDNRATSTLTVEHGGVKASLQLAAGVTELRAIAARTYARTGGATLDMQYGLTKYLDARVRSEVGKSLYAPDAMGQPTWASETMFMLAAHAQ